MGTYSLKNIFEVLQGTNFYTDRIKYSFFKLPKDDFGKIAEKLSKIPNVYSELINDKDELSIIVPQEVWEQNFASDFKPLNSLGEIALITCEVQQETVTGYLLAIVSILSPNNIGVYVQGAFTTDHIFVDYANLDKALKLLNQLKGA